MRFHLKFKRIHATVITATSELFNSGPWTGTDEEKATKFERWLRRASDAYGIPTPTLEVRNVRRPLYDLGQITLPSYSVTELFHTFRHHMQAMGATQGELSTHTEAEHDAIGYACSLYYLVRPVGFRKAVRDGKIRYVGPRDLLTGESLAAYDAERQAAWDAAMQQTSLDGEGEELSDLFDDSYDEEGEDQQYGGSDTLTLSASDVMPVDEPTPTVSDDLISTQEAADLLGVSTSRVLQITDRVGGVRQGRRWSFSRQAVEEYRASR